MNTEHPIGPEAEKLIEKEIRSSFDPMKFLGAFITSPRNLIMAEGEKPILRRLNEFYEKRPHPWRHASQQSKRANRTGRSPLWKQHMRRAAIYAQLASADLGMEQLGNV